VSDEEVLYSSQVDDGLYKAIVVRTGERTAELRIYIMEDETPVHTIPDLHLDYGAVFGPDIANVAEWQQLTLNWVDTHGGEHG
jgi:hypothetical protein